MAEEGVSDIVIKIQNVVCTINLAIRLDLVQITQTARNAEYNPNKFQVRKPMMRVYLLYLKMRVMQAVIMRIREPKATSLMFSTGAP